MPDNEEILNQEAVTEEPVYKRIRLHPVENGEERRNITLWPETGLEGQVSDLAVAVNAKYSKPDDGIPDTDLTSAVQASLGKADTAIQSTDLALVATSGSYNDLTNKPDLDQKLNVKPNDSDYLIANNKIANTYIPDVILGQLKYQGPFNTAYPENPAQGDYYIYNGDEPKTIGGVQYVMGDWAVYNGSSWDKIDNTDAVQSVAGMTGAVTLGISNINGLSDALGTKLEETTKVDNTNQLFNRVYTAVNLNEAYIPKSLSDNYTFEGNTTFNGSTSGIVASDVSGLAAVATSGSYNDLSNKPTSLAKLNVEQSFTRAQHFNSGVSIKAISYSKSYKISETSPTQASLKDVPLELHDLFFSGSRIGGGGILKVFRDQREQGTPPTPEHSWENPAYDESTFHTCWAPAHSPIQRPDASFDKYSNMPWTDWNLVVGNTSSTVEDVKLENPAEPLLNSQHVFTGFDTYSIGYVVSNFSKVILTARWRDSGSGKIEVYSSTFDMQAIAIDVTTSANNNILCVPGPNGEVAKCYIEKDGSGDLHFKWQSGTRASSGVSGWTSVRLAFVN